MNMKKRGMVVEFLGEWAIWIFLFVLIVFGIMALTGTWKNALDYIKNLLRFGR